MLCDFARRSVRQYEGTFRVGDDASQVDCRGEGEGGEGQPAAAVDIVIPPRLANMRVRRD